VGEGCEARRRSVSQQHHAHRPGWMPSRALLVTAKFGPHAPGSGWGLSLVWTQTAGKPAGNEPLGASRNDRQEPGKAMAWQFWQRQGDPRQLRREPMQRDSRKPRREGKAERHRETMHSPGERERMQDSGERARHPASAHRQAGPPATHQQADHPTGRTRADLPPGLRSAQLRALTRLCSGSGPPRRAALADDAPPPLHVTRTGGGQGATPPRRLRRLTPSAQIRFIDF
jgi:hypothetical protein